MFLLLFWFFRSRHCLKKFLLLSGLVFLGCRLSSFGCFADVVALFSFFSFFFERDSSGSHRAHPHTHLVFLFLFLVFVPRRVCLFTRFGRASFPSGVLSGCHSGPRAFFGFSRDFSEAFFLDARRQGCFFASRACVVFPLFVLFCGFFSHDLEGADPSSNEAYPQAIAPALRPSEGQGRGIVLGRLDTAFRDPFFAFMCLAEGHRDPSGLFLWGGGAFSAPSGPFSHALVFCFPPQVFFCFSLSLSLFAGPWGPELDSLTRYPSPIDDGVFSVFCPLRGEIQLLCGMRGKCCPFFEECVSVIPSVCFALFHRISVSNSGLYVGGVLSGVFVCYLRGNAVRFFAARFFGDLGYVLGKILLMSGPLFGKIFGSELLFLSVVVGLVFFDSVLPRLLLYYLIFRSRKCLGKILLMSGPLFGKIFGSELLFLSVVVGLVFFDSVLPRLLLYYLIFRSRKCLGKILLMSGPLFGKIFGSELLFLSVVVGLVFFDSVLPRLLLYYLIFRSRKCLGKILLMSGPLFEKILGSELLFFGVGVGRVCACVFFVLFGLCFCSIIWFFAPENVSKNSLEILGNLLMMHPKHPMYMPLAWESAKARWRETWEFLQKGFLFRISPLPPTLLAFWGWCVSPPSPCSQACPHCLCGVCHECCGGGSACGLGAGGEAPPWHAGRVAGSLLPLDLASRYPCLGLWSLLWGHGTRGVGAWGGWVSCLGIAFCVCVCVCVVCGACARVLRACGSRRFGGACCVCALCVCVGVRGGVVCVLSFSVCVCSFCFCCCSSSLRLLHRGSLLRSSVCFSFSAFVASFCGCGGGGVGRGGGCLGGVGWLGAWVVGRWFGVGGLGWVVWGGWVGVGGLGWWVGVGGGWAWWSRAGVAVTRARVQSSVLFCFLSLP